MPDRGRAMQQGGTEGQALLENQRLQRDRMQRFLVLATERPDLGFSKFGLLGRIDRLALQLGQTIEESQAQTWLRYNDYRVAYERDPSGFLTTATRLRAAYGDDQLRRWGVLVSTE